MPWKFELPRFHQNLWFCLSSLAILDNTLGLKNLFTLWMTNTQSKITNGYGCQYRFSCQYLFIISVILLLPARVFCVRFVGPITCVLHSFTLKLPHDFRIQFEKNFAALGQRCLTTTTVCGLLQAKKEHLERKRLLMYKTNNKDKYINGEINK